MLLLQWLPVIHVLCHTTSQQMQMEMESCAELNNNKHRCWCERWAGPIFALLGAVWWGSQPQSCCRSRLPRPRFVEEVVVLTSDW